MSTSDIGPRGDELKQATHRLVDEVGRKLRREQHGIPKAFDRALFALVTNLMRTDRARAWEDSAAHLPGPEGAEIREAVASLRALHARRLQGRYVRLSDRRSIARSDIPERVSALLNGVEDVVRWKGVPLFKSPLDLVIYQMLLWELRPRTIVEIGSGLGASAIWFGDLLESYGAPGHVYSFDIARPDRTHPRVTFIAGDVFRLRDQFPGDVLDRLEHPVLLIEDAHANLPGVYEFFHPHLVAGDYLVVEDSAEKQECLERWVAATGDTYLVDTRYVDFFGHNATHARDSILVRQEDRH